MTPKLAPLAIVAAQTALLVNLGAPADPEHLRFERQVLMPQSAGLGRAGAGANTAVCAVLDAAALSNSAVPGGGDLRLFRGVAGSPAAAEVPYLLTESGPEPVDPVTVTPVNVVRTPRELQFDLRMPPRPFSELQLQLSPSARREAFVGTVVVTGSAIGGAKSESLGSFGIFQLPKQGLGSWTTLLPAESSDAVLHLTVSLRTAASEPLPAPPPDFVAGVAVPPSRERQTVYTPVVTGPFRAGKAGVQVATLHVPRHVPVEDVQIALSPGPQPNFARLVLLSARADDDPFHEPEVLDAGLLQHVHLPSGDPRLNPIDVQENSFPATVGATLASAATVEVILGNGVGPAPALAAATLAMRERRLCFNAVAGFRYTLRYGDGTLRAPVYAELPYAELPQLTATTPSVRLGPQQRNPRWAPHRDTRPFLGRHPEMFWALAVLCAGMMGGTALQFVQQRGGDRG